QHRRGHANRLAPLSHERDLARTPRGGQRRDLHVPRCRDRSPGSSPPRRDHPPPGQEACQRTARAAQGKPARLDGEGGTAQARAEIGSPMPCFYAWCLGPAVPSPKLLQANRPERPIERKYRMRARAFLARSELGGRLGRGDRDVGPNLEDELTCRPAWGKSATRLEAL